MWQTLDIFRQHSLEELRRAFQFATEKRIPTRTGEGSNVLFSRDFVGLIIKIALLALRLIRLQVCSGGRELARLGLELYQRKLVWAENLG